MGPAPSSAACAPNIQHGRGGFWSTGVRGSGKTVILSKVEEELRGGDNAENGWLVFDVSSARDMLAQIAAMLAKAGFGRKTARGKSLNISASVLGTGGGIGLSSDRDDAFFDIGVEIEEMLKTARKKGKKILLGVDEVSKTTEMVQFASEYGIWLRAGYPVYRDRLLKRGILESRQAYVSFALPFFADYVKKYCMGSE